ncbi:MAG: glycosyltransferase family 39 protein [Candidatus Omnitrophica bacterium]|nr:glycosyltransferase family 39 protein [Candidatus Omnitrophota bacterium]
MVYGNIQKQKKLSKYLVWFLLLMIAVQFLSVCFWLKHKPLPQGKAVNQHLHNAYCLIREIKSGEGMWLSHFMDRVHTYPPLYYICAAVLKIGLGFFSARVILLNSALFYIVLCLSIYYAGEKICEGSGFLSALLLSSYPAVNSALYQFNLEMASLAMVMLAAAMFLFSRGFTDRKSSIAFGIALGFLMLTRQFLIVFLLGPLVYALGRMIKFRNTKKQKNFFISLILAGIIFLPYYCNKPAIMHSLGAVVNIAFFESLNFFQLVGWFIRAAALEGTGLFGGCIAIAALSLSLMQRWAGKKYVYLWVFSPFILLALILVITEKFNAFSSLHSIRPGQERFYFLQGSYVFAVLPAIALRSAVALLKIPHKIIKRICVSGVIMASLFLIYQGKVRMASVTYLNSVNGLGHSIYCEFSKQEQAKKLFSCFNDSREKIGVLSFGSEPAQVSLYTRLISILILECNATPQVIDFFSNPGMFLEFLSQMRYLIIADIQPHEFWPQSKYLECQINNFFAQTGFPCPFQQDCAGQLFLQGYELKNYDSAEADFIFQEALQYNILPDKPVCLSIYRKEN